MQPQRGHKRRPEHVLKPVREEVSKLFTEAIKFSKEKNAKMSVRRVKQARRLGMKYQLKLRDERFCRKCHVYLQQGVNCTIRIKNKIRILRCKECGYVRRKPLRAKQ